MKYIYTTQYTEVASRNFYASPIKIPVGGSFIAEDGETELNYTPYAIILKYKDRASACMDDLAGFFGGYSKRDEGYIGKWSSDLELHANIYYYINGNDITEMIICKYQGLSFANIGGIQYIANVDNCMMDCIPEENDIIFDSKEDAERYIENKY